MTDFALDDQQLEALRPLAAVIEGAIKETPIRLGTDDWGTMLAAGILVRVAAYMGGVLPPVAEAGDWLTRGTRDLSHLEQALVADEGEQRTARRDSLRNLIDRLDRNGALDFREGALLRRHVEAEVREADTARAVARSNLRHVKVLVHEIDGLARSEAEEQQRADIAEKELRVLRSGLRANGADPTQIQNLWAQIRLRNRQWRDAKRERDEAQAAIERMRAVTKSWAPRLLPRSEAHRLFVEVCDAFAGLRPDGTEQPTTEA